MANLNFEYCECGCKCHFASKKGMRYSIYQTLGTEEKPVVLFNGHSVWGILLGKYKTLKEAIEAADKHYEEAE